MESPLVEAYLLALGSGDTLKPHPELLHIVAGGAYISL
jgi:hypothetical protein